MSQFNTNIINHFLNYIIYGHITSNSTFPQLVSSPERAHYIKLGVFCVISGFCIKLTVGTNLFVPKPIFL
ncbi:hypothetical protein RCL_jg29430.t1 [Rhizophagus clarus]|uniref:Uncharacterized protein n=1 Tax=Rhizophagus clarus TaxID=94130 RepID=A0A8H3L0Z5_9GLOM|nr:hypothetical protein RCL_jg29430.t1 [Rhizophagus clarus]